MAELLFIATIVFVAYVVFVVMDEKKGGDESGKTGQPEIPAPQPEKTETLQSEKIVLTAEPVNPASTTPEAKPAAKKVGPAKSTAAKARAAKTSESASATVVDSIKNPKTGEIAKIPGSYSFAKRWIKDALVEEGLLDRVYKNNELDDTVNAKIHSAIQQLKAMEKYQ